MTRVLFWKEYREQRVLWLGVLLLAGIVVGALTATTSLPGNLIRRDTLPDLARGISTVLCGIFALISGTVLLAGESEDETLGFLDTLSGQRLQLWLAKAGAGLTLVLLQLLAQLALLVGLGMCGSFREAGLTLAIMLWISLFEFGLAMFFSAASSSVLKAISKSLGVQVILWLMLPLVFALASFSWRVVGSLLPRLVECVMFLGVFAALPFSALMFTNPTRRRKPPSLTLTRTQAIRSELRVLCWLQWRQMRGIALGLAVWGLVTGMAVPAASLLVWPPMTLLTGLACGLTVFWHEQRGWAYRFLSEQRWPLNRIWLVKLACHGALLVVVVALQVLPAVVLALFKGPALEDWERPDHPIYYAVFSDPLISWQVGQMWFLTLWPIYGFCVGQICGLLFKPLIAAVLALASVLFLVALWVPSLAVGGLHGWQVWGVPIWLLLAVRLLLHAWATDRLGTRGPLLRLGAILCVAGLWLALALAYRVWEVPEIPRTVDLVAYEAGFPTPEQDRAGRALRAAEKEVAKLRAGFMHFGGLRYSWSSQDAELGHWLDKVFQQKWVNDVRAAVDQPPGGLNDPRDPVLRPYRQMSDWEIMVYLLLDRGLQLQAQGDPSAFLDDLQLNMTVTINLRYRCRSRFLWDVRGLERHWLLGLDRWLEKLDGQPELLRRALELLQRYEREMLHSEEDSRKTDYLVALRAVAHPQAWLGNAGIAIWSGETKSWSWKSDLVALCWQVPWEHHRLLRIVRLLFEGTPPEARAARQVARLRPKMFLFEVSSLFDPLVEKYSLARVRAAELKLALRAYQADKGKPAESLQVLVPDYLPAIPLDPYDDKPFRYRLSRGETISLPDGMENKDHFVPAGQGILWSVGADQADQGGHREEATSVDDRRSASDRIFLVPLAPTVKRNKSM